MSLFKLYKDLKKLMAWTKYYLILSQNFDGFMILTIIIGHLGSVADNICYVNPVLIFYHK